MAPEGAAAQVPSVAGAMAVLKAFSGDEALVPPAELARRTGMHKPTVLRLARTLAAEGFLVQRGDGTWRAVLGSVSISGPIERLMQELLPPCAPAVVRAAAQLSWKLDSVSVAALRSTWHP